MAVRRAMAQEALLLASHKATAQEAPLAAPVTGEWLLTVARSVVTRAGLPGAQSVATRERPLVARREMAQKGLPMAGRCQPGRGRVGHSRPPKAAAAHNATRKRRRAEDAGIAGARLRRASGRTAIGAASRQPQRAPPKSNESARAGCRTPSPGTNTNRPTRHLRRFHGSGPAAMCRSPRNAGHCVTESLTTPARARPAEVPELDP